jgi:hypothetical protein
VTAPANKVPVSVDYTGRDYYSLREELIARVKDATNQQWQGNDPADFGLALVESFAYMGDLMNYYIDRVANESYILTATQRQSLLNIASTYGYSPTGYVGSVVDVEFTNSFGSENESGASILTTVNIDGTSTAHVAQLAVPVGNPFEVGDYVIISGFVETAYNGTYEIIKKDLDEFDRTVICYKPESTIATITGDGTKFTVTTSTPHQFEDGEAVVISGSSVSGYNSNWTILSTKDSLGVRTPTQFTVTSTLNTSATGGKVNYQDIATEGDGTTILGYVYDIGTETVPAGTQLVAEVTYEDKVQQVLFTTLEKAVVGWLGNPYNTVSIQCRQGENVAYRTANRKNTAVVAHDIDGELLGYSSGTADQSLALLETRVDKTYLEVFVDSGTNFNKWQQVQHLADYGPNAAVYSVSIDANNLVKVVFGDGVSGAIPPKDAAIKAVYFAGGGPIGNVAPGTITTILSVPTATSPTEEQNIKNRFTVTNELEASGGSDPESNDVIRYNAPRTLSALNRAVTLEDFANLSLSLRGVGKANATAENKNSVTVYVAPSRSDNSTDLTPGVNSSTNIETPAMATLRSTVGDYLSDKKQIGTTVTVGYPSYIPVSLTVEYAALPQYTNEQVASYIKNTLFFKFSYNYVDFADTITPEEIEYQLRQVEGIRNVKVTSLHRTGGSGRTSLIGEASEIFYFLESNLTLNPAPTNANLAPLTGGVYGLTLTTATLNQSFNPDITSYTATVETGVSSIAVVAVADDPTNALITINNTVVASGGTFTLDTAVGTTNLVVSVTAGDGVTVRNYRVAISRVS